MKTLVKLKNDVSLPISDYRGYSVCNSNDENKDRLASLYTLLASKEEGRIGADTRGWRKTTGLVRAGT